MNEGKALNYAEYTQALKFVEEVYAPIVRTRGKKLKVITQWYDPTVNAYATSDQYTFKITMFGGLARHPEMTRDAFIMVACHEMGHHIGGAPQKGYRRVSNEGQSDYFAAHRCMREIFHRVDNNEFITRTRVNQHVNRRCFNKFGGFSDSSHYKVCVRTGMASLSLAKTLASLRGADPRLISANKKDSKVVRYTNDSHPAAQCRFDTYMAGALCMNGFNQVPDFSNPNVGACIRTQLDQRGVRPLCWYKPN